MTKIKGLFKGIRFISQIFVSKEHEMEIGHPTDVRHVAHIGYNGGSSMSSPSWMKEFKTSSDFSLSSLGDFGLSKETSWASQDFDPRAGRAPVEIPSDQSCTEGPKVSKKMKRKKTKSASPSSTSASSTKSSKLRSSCAASMGGVNDRIPKEILVT